MWKVWVIWYGKSFKFFVCIDKVIVLLYWDGFFIYKKVREGFFRFV